MSKKQAAEQAALKYDVTDTITLPIVTRSGESAGTLDVNPEDFGGKISKQLMHDCVLMYRANQRAGTHSTLRRGEVAGSTKKLFRQKGTGNARVGSKRTNKRVGGGTSKGPKPRDYSYDMPKRAIRAATRMALLSKFVDQETTIIDALSLDSPKTKEMADVLRAIEVGKRNVQKGDETVEESVRLFNQTVLIVTADNEPNVHLSARNIPGVQVLPARELNTYQLLKHKRLLLTKDAFNVLREIKPGRRPEAGNPEPAVSATE